MSQDQNNDNLVISSSSSSSSTNSNINPSNKQNLRQLVLHMFDQGEHIQSKFKALGSDVFLMNSK
jgi:hypothetical protein